MNTTVYTPAEVAAVLGKPIRTITFWIKSGRITATKKGPFWLVPAMELEKLMLSAAKEPVESYALPSAAIPDPGELLSNESPSSLRSAETVTVNQLKNLFERKVKQDPKYNRENFTALRNRPDFDFAKELKDVEEDEEIDEVFRTRSSR